MAYTEDDVVEAFRQGHITEPEAKERLQNLKVQLENAKASAPGFMSDVVGHGKAALTGAFKGLAGAAGLPGLLTSFNPRGPQLPQGPEIVSAWQDRGLPLHKPETMGERYTESAFEGLAGVLPTTKLQSLFGLGAGLGAQVGENAIGGDVGRLVGTVPAMVAGAYGLRRPQTVKGLQERFENLPPEALKEADIAAKMASKELGTQVYLPQGMEQPGVVSDLFDMMKGRPRGQEIVTGQTAQRQAGKDKSLEVAHSLFDNDMRQGILDTQKTRGGIVNPESLNDIAMGLRGVKGSTKSVEFDTKIEDLAKARGPGVFPDPVAVRKKANDLMDAVQIASRYQGPAASAKSQIAEESSRGLFQSFLSSFGIYAPFREAGHRLEQRQINVMLDKLIDATLDDKLYEKAQQIIKFSNLGHKVKGITRGLMEAGVQRQKSEVE